MSFIIGKKFSFPQVVLRTVLIFSFIFGFLLGGLILGLKTVTIADTGENKTVHVFAFKVENVLKQAGIAYDPEDVIMPALNETLKNGVEIKILRAAEYSLEADGETQTIKSIETNPRALLAQVEIPLGELDQVWTGINENGLKLVKVVRIIEEFRQEQVEIPYSTFRQPDHKMMKGEQKLLQAGKNGLKVDEIRITFADGVEIEREVVNSEVIEKPIRQVVSYGISGGVAPASRSLQNNVKEIRTMEATAYTHTGNRTATGIYPYKGVVAVDPKVIPLGSKLYVEGYGYAEAQDTGGAIKGDRIDIFLDTEGDCVQWGRRIVQVHFLE